VTRPRFVVHGHFYQPPRLDPVTGVIPVDPTAAPAHDWNERISADCYRPNAVAGNLAAMSWDLGPTLAGWLESGDRVAYEGFVAGEAGANGMAQPFHHPILPLASALDRRTEIRWGLRDFELRFGRRPAGMWLPETAVDLATLRAMADEGISYTILAPWQVEGIVDTRRPHRIDLRDGRSMVVVLYDGLLSAAVSFEPEATIDADAFVRDRLVSRFDGEDDTLVVIATDGELYGHHQPHRERFLARLVGRTAPADRPFEVVPLERAVGEAAAGPLPEARLHERTSWSCHHGVERWISDCPCVADGSWKAPLRTALERLAGGIDSATDDIARGLPGGPDPWAARDD
jgi:alpha-amylase/alpha-mannosidase (GH57 family)